jgi:hypothetical protein
VRVIAGSRRYRAKALLALAVIAAIGAVLLMSGSGPQRGLGGALLLSAAAVLTAGSRARRLSKEMAHDAG